MILAITVIGKDRPGIIAALAGALFKAGGNLEDASMTILEGQFAMIFLAELKRRSDYLKLSGELHKLERRLKLVTTLSEIKSGLVRGEKHRTGTAPWVISASGHDRAGIVYQVSKAIADYKLNISDLNSKIIGSGRSTAYTVMLEVDVPRKGKLIEQLKKTFRKLEKVLGVTIAINPVESAQF